MTYLLSIAAMVPTLLLLDLVWLGVVMKDFYRAQIGHLMASSIAWPAAVVFYLAYAAGIWYFVVMKATSLPAALIAGALLGALCYATYDLSNQATLKDWPLMVTVVDIAWGALLTALASGVGFLVLKALS